MEILDKTIPYDLLNDFIIYHKCLENSLSVQRGYFIVTVYAIHAAIKIGDHDLLDQLFFYVRYHLKSVFPDVFFQDSDADVESLVKKMDWHVQDSLKEVLGFQVSRDEFVSIVGRMQYCDLLPSFDVENILWNAEVFSVFYWFLRAFCRQDLVVWYRDLYFITNEYDKDAKSLLELVKYILGKNYLYKTYITTENLVRLSRKLKKRHSSISRSSVRERFEKLFQEISSLLVVYVHEYTAKKLKYPKKVKLLPQELKFSNLYDFPKYLNKFTQYVEIHYVGKAVHLYADIILFKRGEADDNPELIQEEALIIREKYFHINEENTYFLGKSGPPGIISIPLVGYSIDSFDISRDCFDEFLSQLEHILVKYFDEWEKVYFLLAPEYEYYVPYSSKLSRSNIKKPKSRKRSAVVGKSTRDKGKERRSNSVLLNARPEIRKSNKRLSSKKKSPRGAGIQLSSTIFLSPRSLKDFEKYLDANYASDIFKFYLEILRFREDTHKSPIRINREALTIAEEYLGLKDKCPKVSLEEFLLERLNKNITSASSRDYFNEAISSIQNQLVSFHISWSSENGKKIKQSIRYSNKDLISPRTKSFKEVLQVPSLFQEFRGFLQRGLAEESLDFYSEVNDLLKSPDDLEKAIDICNKYLGRLDDDLIVPLDENQVRDVLLSIEEDEIEIQLFQTFFNQIEDLLITKFTDMNKDKTPQTETKVKKPKLYYSEIGKVSGKIFNINIHDEETLWVRNSRGISSYTVGSTKRIFSGEKISQFFYRDNISYLLLPERLRVYENSQYLDFHVPDKNHKYKKIITGSRKVGLVRWDSEYISLLVFDLENTESEPTSYTLVRNLGGPISSNLSRFLDRETVVIGRRNGIVVWSLATESILLVEKLTDPFEHFMNISCTQNIVTCISLQKIRTFEIKKDKKSFISLFDQKITPVTCCVHHLSGYMIFGTIDGRIGIALDEEIINSQYVQYPSKERTYDNISLLNLGDFDKIEDIQSSVDGLLVVVSQKTRISIFQYQPQDITLERLVVHNIKGKLSKIKFTPEVIIGHIVTPSDQHQILNWRPKILMKTISTL
eukprot:TRINITY_DN6455_c0_g1_i2.p1 TRINITY_DN6455_c0_g1~~TRINITY_DN6455_c0_g1_i2.p1  ORF type:complete len:1069 (+),score=212.53 TRINITY_DN6455_c0_g1_i2:129-3335(+)